MVEIICIQGRYGGKSNAICSIYPLTAGAHSAAVSRTLTRASCTALDLVNICVFQSTASPDPLTQSCIINLMRSR